MIRRQGILARGQTGRQFKYPVGIRHRKEGMRHHADIARHPRMHAANELDENFRVGEGFLQRLGPGSLGEIESGITGGGFVKKDVVQHWVAIADFHHLPGHQSRDHRLVNAALLIDHRLGARRREGLTLETLLDVDEHVGQPLSFAHPTTGQRFGRLQLAAVRVGFERNDHSFGRPRAADGDDAAHMGATGRRRQLGQIGDR